MNSIKIKFNNQKKRISERVDDFAKLKSLVKKIFGLNPAENPKICYIDNENEKIELASEKDFGEVVAYHSNYGRGVTINLELITGIEKDSINIEEMLNNVNLSDSFAVIDQKPPREKHLQLDPSEIKEINSMECSAVSDQLDEENIMYNCFENSEHLTKACQTVNEKADKAVQNDEMKKESKLIETSRVDLVDSGSDPQKVDSKENSTQVVQRIADCGTQAVNQPANETQSKLNIVKTDEVGLVRKLDELLSLKMQALEDSMRKIYESRANSMLQSQQNTCKEASSYQQLNTLADNNNVLKEDPTNKVKDFWLDYKSFSDAPKEEFYFDEFCSQCGHQIAEIKYDCLVCDQHSLCIKCEHTHSTHPLMKVSGDSYKLGYKPEILGIMKSAQKKNIKNYLTKVRTFFTGKIENQIELKATNRNAMFALGKQDQTSFSITVHNISNSDINEEIIIFAKNNKDLKASSVSISALPKGAMEKVLVKICSPNVEASYKFSFNAIIKGSKALVKPLYVQACIVESNKVLETNADLMFGQFEQVKKLSDETKILMYKIVAEGMTQKNPHQIIQIMEKYDFELAEALDELTTYENEEEHDYGEVYYGQEY